MQIHQTTSVWCRAVGIWEVFRFIVFCFFFFVLMTITFTLFVGNPKPSSSIGCAHTIPLVSVCAKKFKYPCLDKVSKYVNRLTLDCATWWGLWSDEKLILSKPNIPTSLPPNHTLPLTDMPMVYWLTFLMHTMLPAWPWMGILHRQPEIYSSVLHSGSVFAWDAVMLPHCRMIILCFAATPQKSHWRLVWMWFNFCGLI